LKDNFRNLGLSALLCCASTVWAQQAPPADAPVVQAPANPGSAKPAKPTAQSEAGEPRANTSDPRADAAAPAPSAARPASAAAAPANAASAKAAPTKAASARAAPANAVDKLQLGTATVTGDREQPKVMYVVPWKSPNIGDAEGKPMNSLVDEILSPVDRDVFRREVRYYQTVKSEAAQNGAQPAAEPAAERVER
jgi:cytoskeletal protein RodZ